jgi:hypothetical protein
MTEAEWLTGTDPQKMQEFLRGKASERKLRLFACACCFRLTELWGILVEDELAAVELANQYADGGATREGLKSVRYDLSYIDDYYGGSEAIRFHALDCVAAVPLGDVNGLANRIIEYFENDHHWTEAEVVAEQEAERVLQCEILRDFFGNRFRRVAVEPSWLTWNDRTIRRLAQAIYDERAFDRLPVLADALEGAGCTNADILGHCRGSGPHVRGCWVVDLLSGKEESFISTEGQSYFGRRDPADRTTLI